MVDLKGGWINLTPEITKTNEGRKIPLHERVVECLAEIRNAQHIHSDFVFPSPQNGGPKNFPREVWERARERAGLDNFRFHDLRHTFVTNARKAGKQDRAIMKITGHKTMSVFMRYDTVDDEDLRKVIED